MSTITHAGTDYDLTVGDYDLEVIFSKKMVAGGMVEEEVFNSNVVAYHTVEPFRNFVNTTFADKGVEKNPQLLLITLGGPDSIVDFIKDARTAGIKGTRAGTARKQSSWMSQLIGALIPVGHSAMKDYYVANKEELWSKCSIPADAQSDDFVQMLINTGRGTIGYKCDEWTGVSSKTGDEGTYAINLNFRLDANNKGRAKRKENGVPETSTSAAAAPAK